MPGFEVTCTNCGKKYTAKVNRHGLCEDCRAIKISETKHRYYEKQKQKYFELKTPEDAVCTKCGKHFLTQRSETICPDCKLIISREKAIKRSNKIRAYSSDPVSVRFEPGTLSQLKDTAEVNLISVNELLRRGCRMYTAYLNLNDEDRKLIDEILNKGKS